MIVASIKNDICARQATHKFGKKGPPSFPKEATRQIDDAKGQYRPRVLSFLGHDGYRPRSITDEQVRRITELWGQGKRVSEVAEDDRN